MKINYLVGFLLLALTKDLVLVGTSQSFIVKNLPTSLLHTSYPSYEATKPFINDADPTRNPTTKLWNNSSLAKTPIRWIVTM